MRGGIKICGIRSVADAERCAYADELGLNFVSGRARAVDFENARVIMQSTRARIVGIVADPDDALVDALVRLDVQTLQLHGRESPARCHELAGRVAVYKAISVRTPDDVRTASDYPGERVLFDAGAGGSGQAFEWSWLEDSPRDYWLAGGLTPDNVAAAILATSALGVDVASGVESSVGVKDAARVTAFVARARAAFLTRGCAGF